MAMRWVSIPFGGQRCRQRGKGRIGAGHHAQARRVDRGHVQIVAQPGGGAAHPRPAGTDSMPPGAMVSNSCRAGGQGRCILKAHHARPRRRRCFRPSNGPTSAVGVTPQLSYSCASAIFGDHDQRQLHRRAASAPRRRPRPRFGQPQRADVVVQLALQMARPRSIQSRNTGSVSYRSRAMPGYCAPPPGNMNTTSGSSPRWVMGEHAARVGAFQQAGGLLMAFRPPARGAFQRRGGLPSA
jgi:hypothetical protein